MSIPFLFTWCPRSLWDTPGLELLREVRERDSPLLTNVTTFVLTFTSVMESQGVFLVSLTYYRIRFCGPIHSRICPFTRSTSQTGCANGSTKFRSNERRKRWALRFECREGVWTDVIYYNSALWIHADGMWEGGENSRDSMKISVFYEFHTANRRGCLYRRYGAMSQTSPHKCCS